MKAICWRSPSLILLLCLVQGANAGEKIYDHNFGLFRGEIMVDMAEHYFRVRLDPKKAFASYDRAWDWLSKVEAFDQRMDNFKPPEVPGKAREVTKPPAEEKREDVWGKIAKNEPRLGAIVNRRTAPWYLDDLREKCALALGFLHFARGETEKALEWYAKVPALDKATGRLGGWRRKASGTITAA